MALLMSLTLCIMEIGHLTNNRHLNVNFLSLLCIKVIILIKSLKDIQVFHVFVSTGDGLENNGDQFCALVW